MLTTEKIRKMAHKSAYEKGMQIRYSKKRILDFLVEKKAGRRRSNGELDVVSAMVRGSNGEVYEVELEYDEEADRMTSASCQCLAFENYDGLCKHCVAVSLMFADWQVKQKLYGRDGEGRKAELTAQADRQRQLPGDSTETAAWEPLTPLTPQIPSEHTSEAMKQLLEKQTRRRTAPLTEQQVHGKVRLEPSLELGVSQDHVSFRIGAEKLYVLKDLAAFAVDVMTQQDHAYGKKLSFTHSMDSFQPESRPLVEFVLRRFPDLADQRDRNLMRYGMEPGFFLSAQRTVTLAGDALEELIDACGTGPLLVTIETREGMSRQEPFFVTAGWPKHPMVLRGEYGAGASVAEYGAGSPDAEHREPEMLTGLRGETGELVVRRGTRFLFAFQDGCIYRMPLAQIGAIEDWVLQLAPKPRPWTGSQWREYAEGSRKRAKPEPRVERFFIERSDVPAFCRELLPQLKKVFDVRCENFSEADFVMSRAAFRFYLDSPQKDVVTCRAEAWYGGERFPLYEGEEDGGTGIGRRDLLEELAVRQAMKSLLPVAGAGGVHMIAGDESALYDFLTEGMASLQNLGAVFVSDALRRMEVRPSPRVSVGVSLSGDLLQLTMEAEGLSRQELAEILSRYDRKKKYHRLKNGDFIRLDGEELAALAEMEQGLGLSEKQLAREVVELPRFRALYLDGQMREKEALPVERSRDFRTLVRNMKTVEDNDFEVPESLKGVLRGYQKRGFLWLKTLAAGGFGGILADDMGLGKTLQVIAFLLSEMEEGRRQPSLIVCPASLVYNWENEIRRFAPQLPVQVIAGNAPERAALIGDLKKSGGAGTSLVCITSYELLRRDVELYDGVTFGCQVIDEAQYIKNHGTKAAHAVKHVRSAFRVALTGTPIENRLSELWSIFDYLMPGFLYSYDQFHKRIEKPVVSGQNEEVMGRLQKMIAPFVLRRLKKDVLRDLPDKIEENMMTRLEGEQRELYDAQVQNLKLMLENQSEEEFRQSRISVLAALTRLRQICCDPALLYEGYQGPAAKVELCMDMVENGMEGGHKMLVFSQFTSMLEILEQKLQQAEIPYYKLTGATPKEERIRLVDAFNREESAVPVFLISLKAGGTGLNLTAADMVLHFDPWWNLAVQNQATDRAHRIGQKQVVNVYKLIARDTIEENIVRLQERKRELADRVLGGEGLGSGTFSREELLEILG